MAMTVCLLSEGGSEGAGRGNPGSSGAMGIAPRKTGGVSTGMS